MTDHQQPMTTATEYSARSSARRAAKRAGRDPDQVEQTEGGKWVLPPAETAARDQAAAEHLQGNGPVGALTPFLSEEEAHPLDIPEELRVENRRPLTEEQQARVTQIMRSAGVTEESERRVDYRKPKGASWEEWDAHIASEAASKREKSLERIAKLKEKKPPKEPRALGYKGHAAGSRVADLHREFDTKGLDAAIALGRTIGYIPSTTRRLAEKWRS